MICCEINQVSVYRGINPCKRLLFSAFLSFLKCRRQIRRFTANLRWYILVSYCSAHRSPRASVAKITNFLPFFVLASDYNLGVDYYL